MFFVRCPIGAERYYEIRSEQEEESMEKSNGKLKETTEDETRGQPIRNFENQRRHTTMEEAEINNVELTLEESSRSQSILEQPSAWRVFEEAGLKGQSRRSW